MQNSAKYSHRMWEALLRLDATPEEIAAVCEDVTVLEAAEELSQACERMKQAEAEIRKILRGAVPVHESPDQQAAAAAYRSTWNSG